MKKLLSMLLCAVMTVTCIGAVPAHAASSDTRLRVGLTISGASTFAAPQLENVSGYRTGYTVGTVSGTAFSGSKSITSSALTVKLVNDAFQVSDTDSGSVLYTSAAGADHIAIRPNSTLTWFKGYKWYGDFVYRRASNGSITVINYVGVEDYVKGVLPYEIDPDWPAEAQKAQAVCARSFALGTHKHGSEYDLCNTTNCQVYLGANRATETSDAAVDATKGETLSYNGSSVIGYFYSSDGGATEDAANVWGGDYAYLKGKADPYEDPNKDKWTVTLTADEIQQKMNAAGYSIGKVANVQVTKRTATDNVNEVTVTDTSGKSVTISRSSVRTVFGLKSIRYTITPVGGSGNKTSLQVKASTHNVKVNGKTVSPQGYYIVNGTQYGNNYFKLRDIAYLLSGTKGQFNVRWDKENERILLTSGTRMRLLAVSLRIRPRRWRKSANPPRRLCSTARRSHWTATSSMATTTTSCAISARRSALTLILTTQAALCLSKPQATIPAMTRTQIAVIRAIPARIPRRPLPIRPVIRSAAPAGDTASA